MTDSSGINAHRFLPTLASCLSRPLRSDGPILILGPTGQMKLIYSAGPLAGGSNNKLPDCRPVIHLLLRFILWPTNRFINGVHSIKSPRWDSFRFEKPAPSYRFLSSVHLSVFFPPFSSRPCPLIGHSIGSQLRRQHTLEWQAKWSESEKSLRNEDVRRRNLFKTKFRKYSSAAGDFPR